MSDLTKDPENIPDINLELSELEFALFQRNLAEKKLLQAEMEIEFGERKREISEKDQDLWARVKERLGIDLAEFVLETETGNLLRRDPVEDEKPPKLEAA